MKLLKSIPLGIAIVLFLGVNLFGDTLSGVLKSGYVKCGGYCCFRRCFKG